MQHDGKHPVMTHAYESVNVPGMYFAGASDVDIVLNRGHLPEKERERERGRGTEGGKEKRQTRTQVLPCRSTRARARIARTHRACTRTVPLATLCPRWAAATACPRAGALAHGKDAGRSAGGAIRGFRYTARALFRVLEAKYHQRRWPGAEFALGNVALWGARDDAEDTGLGYNGCNAGDWDAPPMGCFQPVVHASALGRLAARVFDRVNTASGPYHMAGVLGDGAVLRCGGPGPAGAAANTTVTASYIEEMPHEHFNAVHGHLPRFFWHFADGGGAGSGGGARPQVHLWWYPGDCTGAGQPVAKGGVAVKELLCVDAAAQGAALHRNWNTWETRRQVLGWLHGKIGSLQPRVASPPAAEEWARPCPLAVGQEKMITCMNKPEFKATMNCVGGEGDICECFQLPPGLETCMGRTCLAVIRTQLDCTVPLEVRSLPRALVCPLLPLPASARTCTPRQRACRSSLPPARVPPPPFAGVRAYVHATPARIPQAPWHALAAAREQSNTRGRCRLPRTCAGWHPARQSWAASLNRAAPAARRPVTRGRRPCSGTETAAVVALSARRRRCRAGASTSISATCSRARSMSLPARPWTPGASSSSGARSSRGPARGSPRTSARAGSPRTRPAPCAGPGWPTWPRVCCRTHR